MTPKVRAVLGDSIVSSTQYFRAGGDWIPGYGHGLNVQVWVSGDSSTYTRDFLAELDGAGTILARLAGSEITDEWDFIDIEYRILYGELPPWDKTLGIVKVLVQRDTLKMLCGKGAPSKEYPYHASTFRGYKGQPDSDEMLRLREE
jgi:hypothetical protein